jgi:hypothetical protein
VVVVVRSDPPTRRILGAAFTQHPASDGKRMSGVVKSGRLVADTKCPNCRTKLRVKCNVETVQPLKTKA